MTEPLTGEKLRLARLMLPILVEKRDAIAQTIAGIERIEAIRASAAVATTIVEGIIAAQSADSTETASPQLSHEEPKE
jgi:hypothetical protein